MNQQPLKRSITSDEEALELLAAIVEGKAKDIGVNSIVFEGWPVLNVRLNGDRFDGSLTPQTMESFIAMQKAVNRTYGLLVYGNSGKRLSAEERDKLQLVVKVDKGSTETAANVDEIIQSMLLAVGDKLTGEQALIAILGLGLMGFTTYGVRHYLNNRKEIRIAEISSQKDARQAEVRMRELGNMEFVAEQDKQKIKLITDALSHSVRLSPIQDIVEDAHSGFLKGAAGADSASVFDSELTAGQISELKTNARARSEEVSIVGIFSVQMVDTKDPDKFRVRLVRVSDHFEITAYLPSDNTEKSKGIRESIRNAEWSRSLIECAITARTSRDKISRAEIVGASVQASS